MQSNAMAELVASISKGHSQPGDVQQAQADVSDSDGKDRPLTYCIYDAMETDTARLLEVEQDQRAVRLRNRQRLAKASPLQQPCYAGVAVPWPNL